jgi:NAD dependent epimerase/dehydratase family enzyme
MADTKRVIVTGATGLIGKQLCFQLAAKGYEVVVCSRNPESARRMVPEAAEHVAWAAAEDGPWASAIDGAYAVINLAGANLFGKRWNEAYKREIRDSRVIGTRGLVNAMAKAQHKPAVFISGSAVGYYGFRDDTKLDESAAPGDDFLARMCVQWEQEATRAEELGIRTVLIRSGIVLSKPDGALPINLRGASWSRPGIVLDTRHGALPLMALPFRFFVGGPILPGNQWFSWIHIDDEVGLIRLTLENEQARGPINATAPEPQTNREFSKTLGKVIGRPAWLPVPGFALKLMLGELAGMVTQGQRVVPQQAQKLGYPFKYPTSDEALRDLLK